jgi:hypothetical protein
VSRPACTGTRKDGSPCRAPALPDSALCWVHDPRQAEQAVRARTAGASKGGKVRALQSRRRKLDTPAALVRFVSEVVQDALAGTVPPDIAKAVLYGVSIQRQLIESSDVVERIEQLEARLQPKESSRWNAR